MRHLFIKMSAGRNTIGKWYVYDSIKQRRVSRFFDTKGEATSHRDNDLNA